MGNNFNKEILYGFEKLFSINRLLLWNISKKSIISPLQLQILYYIEHNNIKLPSELSEELEISKATVSESLSNMQKKGLIKKERNHKDKRKYQIILTEKAYQLLEELKNRDKILLKALNQIDEDAKLNFYKVLKQLIKELINSGIIKRAKICYKCQNFQIIDGKFYCKFLGQFITEDDIRLNCPEFLLNQN